MGYDLTIRGSNTKIIETQENDLNVYNDYVWDDFFTLSSKIENSWSDGRALVNKAPIVVEENNSSDFTWNTGIYTYEEIMELPENPTVSIVKKMVKENKKVPYIFIQMF